MKIRLSHLVLFFSLITVLNSKASSIHASGYINSAAAWTADTVKVTGDVYIFSKLTIAPGTIVELHGNYEIYVNPGGSLISIGTVNDSIHYTYYDTTQFYNNTTPAGGWKGIRICTTTSDSTILSYCSVQFIKNSHNGTLNNYNAYAIFIWGNGNTRMSNCSIRNNSMDIDNPTNNSSIPNGGTIILCQNGSSLQSPTCSPLIQFNTITNNKSGSGSLSCSGLGCNPIINRNNISYNIATLQGGGIHCASKAMPIITNNYICNNSNSRDNGCFWMTGGGGIVLIDTANAYIANNVIANNSSVEMGGGIKCLDSYPTLINNNIVNNHSDMEGGGICLLSSNPVITNNIIWGNTKYAGISNQIAFRNDGCDPNILNSCIEGGVGAITQLFGVYTGNYINNINSNPNFISPSAGSGYTFDGIVNADWRLQLSSLCINTGTNNALGNIPSVDLWYNPRIQGSSIDMGAYEAPGEFNPNGINESTNNSALFIYPNPATDHFTINYAKDYEQATISVVNAIGQTIETKSFNNSEKIIFITADYSKGAYFLNILIDEERMSTRLIIK